MARLPIINNLRISPRDADFLDRKTGARGEIFYDQTNNTLRVFNAEDVGGMPLVKVDLSNVSNAAFLAKAELAGVGGGSGSIELGDTSPSAPETGTIWFNTSNARLYVYTSDGSSNQWVQPVSGLESLVTSILDLGISDGTNGQILTTNGSGTFTFEDAPQGFDGEWSSLSNTPTTLAGYGITDASTFDGAFSSLTGTPTTLGGYGITDGVTSTALTTTLADYATTTALTTATANSSQWDSAYSWGNHALSGYLTAITSQSIKSLSDVDSGMSPALNQVLKWNGSQWSAGDDSVAGVSGVVNGATQANPVVITSFGDHGLYEGQPVTFSSVGGMTELNGNDYFADVLTSGTFALYSDSTLTTPVDGTGFTAFTTGGVFTGGASAASVGNFTFTGNIIDTGDSSAVSFTPAVVMNSDLTVENNVTVNNDLTVSNNLTVQGSVISQGSGVPELFSDNEIQLTAGTRVEVTSSPIKMASFTTAQRDLLTAQNGDLIYNTTTNKFQGYENGSWVNLV